MKFSGNFPAAAIQINYKNDFENHKGFIEDPYAINRYAQRMSDPEATIFAASLVSKIKQDAPQPNQERRRYSDLNPIKRASAAAASDGAPYAKSVHSAFSAAHYSQSGMFYRSVNVTLGGDAYTPPDTAHKDPDPATRKRKKYLSFKPGGEGEAPADDSGERLKQTRSRRAEALANADRQRSLHKAADYQQKNAAIE